MTPDSGHPVHHFRVFHPENISHSQVSTRYTGHSIVIPRSRYNECHLYTGDRKDTYPSGAGCHLAPLHGPVSNAAAHQQAQSTQSLASSTVGACDRHATTERGFHIAPSAVLRQTGWLVWKEAHLRGP